MSARDKWLKGKNIATTNDCLLDSASLLSNKRTNDDDDECYTNESMSLLEMQNLQLTQSGQGI
eukprot:1254667-Ditylum_brightwellii.AAC.1